MCGFISLIKKNNINNFDLQITDPYLRHRGPDGSYNFEDQHVSMRFHRLAIIDIAGGQQPFKRGSIVTMFNGEIYNYRELRQHLAQLGYNLTNQSDSEVIPFLYMHYGHRFVEKLEGMFAIFLYDIEKGTFFIYRDHLGIKPLYITETKDFIAVASEIKPLLSLPGVSREINQSGLEDYLSFGFCLETNNFFKDVKKIPKASVLTIDQNKKQSIETYWHLQVEQTKSFTTEEVLSEFDRSVKLHLQSDVKLCAFLSGGFDSSLIVARAAKMQKLTTYTIDFVDAQDRESQVAQDVANKFNTDHHEIKVNSKDLLEYLPEIIWAQDDPLSDTGTLPNYFISKIARNDGCKVALAGTGGDEIFGGYNYYFPNNKEKYALPLSPLFYLYGKMFPNNLGQKVGRIGSAYIDQKSHYLGHTQTFNSLKFIDSNLSVSNKRAQSFKNQNASSTTKKMFADIQTYLPDNLLSLQDRMTMINGIEGRVPFLNWKFVSMVYSMKEDMKFKNNEKKYFLKNMSKGILPESVFKMKKIGFCSPVHTWLQTEGFNLASKVLKSESFLNRSFVDKNKFKNYDLKKLNNHQIWNLFNLELFCQLHLDEKSQPQSKIKLKEMIGM